MNDHKIKSLTGQVCDDFLKSFLKSINDRHRLSGKEQIIKRATLALSEFQNTGKVLQKKKFLFLDGEIGQAISVYHAFRQTLRLSKITIQKDLDRLSIFNFWMFNNGILKLSDISHSEINCFIKSLDPDKKARVFNVLVTLKCYLSFLFESKMTLIDLSRFIPHYNYRRQAKLPSYYSEDEIVKLLASINRTTASGKRDFAVICIAANLGLRASDIAGLKFDNLHWEENFIEIKQYKTNKILKLPLTPVVGNALLDYIQYGRPKSDESFIFLRASHPNLPVSSGTITSMIDNKFCMSKLDIGKRKHGCHALRHSLVKELLQNKETIPVIMEVLGHKSVSSTRHYIRIDTEALRNCALDVPVVDPLFYSQRTEHNFYQ